VRNILILIIGKTRSRHDETSSRKRRMLFLPCRLTPKSLQETSKPLSVFAATERNC